MRLLVWYALVTGSFFYLGQCFHHKCLSASLTEENIHIENMQLLCCKSIYFFCQTQFSSHKFTDEHLTLSSSFWTMPGGLNELFWLKPFSKQTNPNHLLLASNWIALHVLKLTGNLIFWLHLILKLQQPLLTCREAEGREREGKRRKESSQQQVKRECGEGTQEGESSQREEKVK